MVATLLSLKLHLVIAELKRSTVRLVLWIILALYVLSIVGALLIGLALASMAIDGYESQAASITVIAGSVLVVGWTLLPLVFFGSDQTLDPARFTLFPLTGRQMAPGLLLAGALGLPGLSTALLSLGSALPWLRSPLVLLVGLVGGALGFAMAQIGCRLASTALSGTLSSRKAKDMTGLIGLVMVLVLSMGGYSVSLVISFLTSSPDSFGQVIAISERIATVMSWTPLGAPWALVGDAGQGLWLLMLARLAVTLIYVALGVWAYMAVLDRSLVAPTRAQAKSVVARGDIIDRVSSWWWARGQMIPVAAITARCLRYWRRDPRYLGQIPAVLMMPILFSVMGWGFSIIDLSGTGETLPPILTNGLIALGLGLMAIIAGYSLSADIAYDSTAWWIHLATGVKGWQDRLGRVIPQAIWALPVILITGIVVPCVLTSPTMIPATLGAMMTLYLSGLGFASVFSALIVYPVALPGESPLKMKTGMMGSQMLSQLGCLTIAGLLALPVCIWALFASGWQRWLVLIVGILWGAGLLVAGIIIGGRIMDSRGPTILATLKKNDSS